MIEILTAVMAAGDSRDFHVNGERFEILDCQYPIDVLLMDKAGAQQSTMKNAEASFFAQPREGFQTIKITSAQAQVVRMFVGSGDAGTRRISSTVSVIDGEKARTMAGVMFLGAPGHLSSGGNFPQVQLWNPAGSGKRAVINQVSVTSNVAQGVNCYYTLAAASVDVSANYLGNKLGAGPVGAAQVRHAGAGIVGAVGFAVWSAFAPASGLVPWPIRGGIVCPPGVGLSVGGGLANSSLIANFEWFEEAI